MVGGSSSCQSKPPEVEITPSVTIADLRSQALRERQSTCSGCEWESDSPGNPCMVYRCMYIDGAPFGLDFFCIYLGGGNSNIFGIFIPILGEIDEI